MKKVNLSKYFPILFGVLFFLYFFSANANQFSMDLTQFNQAVADQIQIPVEHDDIYQVVQAPGFLYHVNYTCVSYSPCEGYASQIVIGFILPGCMDDLGHVDYRVQWTNDGRLQIFLAAQMNLRKSSWAATCNGPNMKFLNISIPGYHLTGQQIQIVQNQ